MRALTVSLVALLLACGQGEIDRSALNVGAHTRQVGGLTVTTEGAAIVETEVARGDCPPSVTIRAQSFDARVDVQNNLCGPQALLLTVRYLPGGALLRTARTFLGAVEARVAATRAVAGGGLAFEFDPHDPAWTALAAETPFDTTSSAAGATPGTEEKWTLCTDRNRMAWRLLDGHRPASACRFDTVQAGDTLPDAPVEAPCDPDAELAPELIDAAAGACVTYDAPDNDPLSLAPLVVRHRLRLDVTPEDCIRFAVWGNIAGDIDVLRRINDEVARAEPLFVLITGDLTADGNAFGLGQVALRLDGLPVPWYATLGDRDVVGSAGEDYRGLIGASTFAFDAGPVRIIVLDSGDLGLASVDRRALSDWLGPDSRLWWSTPPPPARLVFTHVPPFDPSGARGDAFRHRPEAAALVAALRRGQVPLLFSSQFAIYDEQDVARTRVIHSGGGGAPMELTSGDVHHWLLVTVNGPDCTDPQPCTLPDPADCPCIDVQRIDLGAALPDLPECRPAAAIEIGAGL